MGSSIATAVAVVRSPSEDVCPLGDSVRWGAVAWVLVSSGYPSGAVVNLAGCAEAGEEMFPAMLDKLQLRRQGFQLSQAMLKLWFK